MNSYDMNGNKQSFANWVSMLRTYETPFLNLVDTEKVNHVLFSWQTDKLAASNKNNSAVEGSDATPNVLIPTKVLNNVTQILAKVVKVSDTAAKVESWGRKKETIYQLEKASKEIFKDLEWSFLNNTAMEPGNHGKARLTAGVRGLASDVDVPCPMTGAITHKVTDKEITEDDLFDLTYNLYLSGSKANLICFHPSKALFFSNLMESETKARIFKNNPKLMLEVHTLVDPLGQRYALLPLRQMPKDVLYVFNAKDFTQMVLRAPKRTLLDRDGSYDKWLMDMEVGLRLNNPYSVGILQKAFSDQTLLKKTRDLNTVSTQGGQVAIDFVKADGHWQESGAHHEIHFAVGNFLKVSVASNDSRVDKLSVKAYDVTVPASPILIKEVLVDSDEKKKDITIVSSLVDADSGKSFKIVCDGYFGTNRHTQTLGTFKITKTPTP